MPVSTESRPCSFCTTIAHGIPEANRHGSVATILDTNPVTEGHHLVIPVRHVLDFFDMSDTEARDAHAALHELRSRLQQADPRIAGFNVGMNCGSAAGQTIFHAHIHLIPRRPGDTPDPRGGVRGVVPARMSY
jgi:diadenosine tetraphosphate (Ap4A) HIT family hydrolase